MCIFSGPVTSVDDTQIFARRSEHDTQFLVYQMRYESAEENAMILPVPVRQPARDDSLRFIDLSHYETFFEDLADGFPFIRPAFACAAPPASVRPGLEVYQVGNYVASFVPTLADFSRLDSRFRLPDATWLKLPQYSAYGFAVFQLAEGSRQPHPMAFEFRTGSREIYFPTMHIHDGEVHAAEEFDHVLYLQHAAMDGKVRRYVNYDVPDRTTNLVRSDRAARNFCRIDASQGIVLGDLLVHRRLIRGIHPNRDVVIPAGGHPTIPPFNYRRWLAFTPWLVALAVVAWFFARRNRLKRQRAALEADEEQRDVGR